MYIYIYISEYVEICPGRTKTCNQIQNPKRQPARRKPRAARLDILNLYCMSLYISDIFGCILIYVWYIVGIFARIFWYMCLVAMYFF